MEARAEKDSGTGFFRVFMYDDNGERLVTREMGTEEVEVPATDKEGELLLDKEGQPRTKREKRDVELSREEAATVGIVIAAVKGSETLNNMPFDGGGFERWRPAQQLAALLNKEIMEATHVDRKALRADDGNGAVSADQHLAGTGSRPAGE